MNMLRTIALLAGMAATSTALAQVTFYEDDGFRGRSFNADRQVANFERIGFNDRASSAVVRGGNWEVCEDAQFQGQCVLLRPGRYPSLREVGLNDRISSVRPAGNGARRNDRRGDLRDDRIDRRDDRIDRRGDRRDERFDSRDERDRSYLQQ